VASDLPQNIARERHRSAACTHARLLLDGRSPCPAGSGRARIAPTDAALTSELVEIVAACGAAQDLVIVSIVGSSHRTVARRPARYTHGTRPAFAPTVCSSPRASTSRYSPLSIPLLRQGELVDEKDTARCLVSSSRARRWLADRCQRCSRLPIESGLALHDAWARPSIA